MHSTSTGASCDVIIDERRYAQITNLHVCGAEMEVSYSSCLALARSLKRRLNFSNESVVPKSTIAPTKELFSINKAWRKIYSFGYQSAASAGKLIVKISCLVGQPWLYKESPREREMFSESGYYATLMEPLQWTDPFRLRNPWEATLSSPIYLSVCWEWWVQKSTPANTEKLTWFYFLTEDHAKHCIGECQQSAKP